MNIEGILFDVNVITITKTITNTYTVQIHKRKERKRLLTNEYSNE